MLGDMRKLIWITAFLCLGVFCAAQQRDQIRVEIALRGGDTLL